MDTKKRAYPRAVWVLQPSFKPVQVEVVEQYSCWSPGQDYGDVTAKGKLYRVDAMFPNKAEAIAAGRAQLVAQQERLDKQGETIFKKLRALAAAEKTK